MGRVSAGNCDVDLDYGLIPAKHFDLHLLSAAIKF
jgi:hypothetical protein